MRNLYYKVAVVGGLLYFISPFLTRGAEHLLGRGVAELLGLVFVIVGLVGAKTGSRRLASVLFVGGLISCVWAGVGPWLHHFPGAFDALLFGLFYMGLYWLITRSPSAEELKAKQCSVRPATICIDEKSYTLAGLNQDQDNLNIMLHSQAAGSIEKRVISIDMQSILALGAALENDKIPRLARKLVQAAEEIHKAS